MHNSGTPARCLLDTGTQVSTISESFFRDHLMGREEDVFPTSKWLKLTAANSLPIPYLGYTELDVETIGLSIPECGFLVVKDLPQEGSTEEGEAAKSQLMHSVQVRVPGLIGMNIIKGCKQLVTSEFDTTLGERLGPDCREAFQKVQTCEVMEKTFIAKIWDRQAVHLLAFSVATVFAKGVRSSLGGKINLSLEPAQAHLPSGLIVVPTLVEGAESVFPVRVVNLSGGRVGAPLDK